LLSALQVYEKKNPVGEAGCRGMDSAFFVHFMQAIALIFRRSASTRSRSVEDVQKKQR